MKTTMLLLAIFALSAASCTGTNLGNQIGATANTHPARDYASAAPLRGPAEWRGGLIFHRNSVPGQIGNAVASKTGRSCSHAALYLAAWGDSSIETAKKKAGITKVASVEHEVMGIGAVLYHRHCTVVQGS